MRFSEVTSYMPFVRTMTVSLRKDEDQRINEICAKHGLKRHEVVKLAIRRFLFPEEKVVPLNGKVAAIRDRVGLNIHGIDDPTGKITIYPSQKEREAQVKAKAIEEYGEKDGMKILEAWKKMEAEKH